MTLLMLATVVGLSLFHLNRSAALQLAMTEQQIRGITRTLESSSFPLTSNVLMQMKGLAGAEFVLIDDQSDIQATTRTDWDIERLLVASHVSPQQDIRLSISEQIQGSSYLHAAVQMRPRDAIPQGGVLHVFYPQDLFEQQRRAAVLPTITIGSVALILTLAAATLVALRVTRPLSVLGRQVTQIAQGDFEEMPLPATKDEVRELSVAVNTMAKLLASYEDTVRRTEQVRTLGQLGAALAHQLRNSATGTRLALDIHRTECPNGEDSESLDVASVQLVLMEKYIRRFLSLGTRQSRPKEQIDFVELLRGLLPLVEPTAKHAEVMLSTSLPDQATLVLGERDGMEHMLLNLMLNAVEAATASQTVSRQVSVTARVEDQFLFFCVEDNGAGLPEDIASSVFEPFVTSKPDGIGLGLAIVKQVVFDHQGAVSWSRQNGVTKFLVELPLVECNSEKLAVVATSSIGNEHAEPASR